MTLAVIQHRLHPEQVCSQSVSSGHHFTSEKCLATKYGTIVCLCSEGSRTGVAGTIQVSVEVNLGGLDGHLSNVIRHHALF